MTRTDHICPHCGYVMRNMISPTTCDRCTKLMRSKGQADYEADIARRPTYHDGQSRRTWDQLSAWARSSWEPKGDAR